MIVIRHVGQKHTWHAAMYCTMTWRTAVPGLKLLVSQDVEAAAVQDHTRVHYHRKYANDLRKLVTSPWATEYVQGAATLMQPAFGIESGR